MYPSLSTQVIYRGERPAGYGFVAFKTAEAAQRAVDLLNKKELDGRTLIVEIAKLNYEKERRERRSFKKRPKKVRATADASPALNGAADAPETKESGETPATTEDAPKSKKKRTTVSLSK
jgi:RNA recognition motif-containing protein